jgi:CPA1 family monovalent cation:H+ antiporter
MQTFWEYLSFVVNSLVFLLIGIEVHVSQLAESWKGIVLGIGTVILGRALSVYLLGGASRFFGAPIPMKWQHILLWGGIHGSVSMALALSLGRNVPYRDQILTMTFGVVAFSIVVQGLTVKPLLRFLGIESTREDDYDLARVRHSAYKAASRELDGLHREQLISAPVYRRLREELEGDLERVQREIAAIQEQEPSVAEEETRLARVRIISAEKSSIQRSANLGLISLHAAEKMLADADRRLDELSN